MLNTHVVPPADGVEGNGINILVEDKRQGHGEVENVEALRTDVIGKNFNAVRDDQWRECNTVHNCQ